MCCLNRVCQALLLRALILFVFMDQSKLPYYLHVAHARDLTGRDRLIFRLFEMIPGLVAWGTILFIVILSWRAPVAAAYFIIAFDLYWLLKTIYLSVHQRHNFRRLRHNMEIDWNEKMQEVEYKHLYHLVLLPFYKESEEVVRQNLDALLEAQYDHKKLIIALAAEERAGEEAKTLANSMQEEYTDKFGHFIVTVHPDGLEGEIRGKGPNITWAAEETRKRVLDPNGILYTDVIVSAFDIDTVVLPQYFLCLAWHVASDPDPHRASFQPVPLYNNNIWDAPAVSRVAAFSSTFWQMIQQERPEKLTTFSSHAVSFQALYEVGYWQKNMVSDDSRIFWNLFMANDGNYRTVPISYPVSMDANLAPTTLGTCKNIYKQHLRWSWGVENIPYMLFGFLKNKKIQRKKKWHNAFIQIEGFWSLATNPLVILLLGWLPLILGGPEFRDTVLSYNLPIVTRNLMILAMMGLIVSAFVAYSLMPKMPGYIRFRKVRYVASILQWILVPFTIVIFGAIPGLHAQTKLMFGRYMGFWVTPKHRVQK